MLNVYTVFSYLFQTFVLHKHLWFINIKKLSDVERNMLLKFNIQVKNYLLFLFS